LPALLRRAAAVLTTCLNDAVERAPEAAQKEGWLFFKRLDALQRSLLAIVEPEERRAALDASNTATPAAAEASGGTGFKFVTSPLIDAMRTGKWVLLDSINCAPQVRCATCRLVSCWTAMPLCAGCG
jgi:hypothetical protein